MAARAGAGGTSLTGNLLSDSTHTPSATAVLAVVGSIALTAQQVMSATARLNAVGNLNTTATAALLGLATLSGNSSIIPGFSKLLARWTFDSNTVSGSTVNDVSGNQHNGTLNGAASVVATGPFGPPDGFNASVAQAANFTGANTSFFQIPNADGLKNATSWTLYFWDTQANTNPAFVAQWGDGAASGILITDAGGSLQMSVGTASGAVIGSSSGGSTTAKRRICITYDESSATQNVQIYVNGKALTTNMTNAGAGRPMVAPSSDLFFAGGYTGSPSSFPYPGALDDIQFFLGVQTAAQVSTDYFTVSDQLIVSASLIASSFQMFAGAARLPATSSLSASADRLAGAILGNAILPGDSSLSSTASQMMVALAALNGNSSLSATATAVMSAIAQLNGSANLSATATQAQQATALLSGIGSIAADLKQLQQATALLSSVSTLSASADHPAFATAVLSGAGNFGPPLVTEGLGALWTFDSGTGVDTSGNGNDGTLTGSTPPSITAGIIGPAALRFNGTTAYVSVPDSPTLRPNPLTLAIWARPISPLQFSRLISKGDGPARNWGLGKQDTKLAFFYYDSTGLDSGLNLWQSTATWASLIPNNSSHHVAVTYTSGSGSSLQMYVDGVLVPGSWTNGTGNAALNYTATPVRIGASSYPLSTPASNEYWNGDLDDGRIYNRQLSAGEILNLFRLTQGLRLIQYLVAFAQPSGVGTIAATGKQLFNATATLPATASLIAASLQALSAQATLPTIGSLTASSTQRASALATLPASSDIAANATHNVTATAVLGCSGTINASTNSANNQITATLAGSAALIAASMQLFVSRSTLTASSDLIAAATHNPLAFATLPITSSLSAATIALEAITALLPGTAFISAQAIRNTVAISTLAGSASIIVDALHNPNAFAILSIESSLTASASHAAFATALLAGSADVSADTLHYMAAFATLGGNSSLSANLVRSTTAWPGSAQLGCESSLIARAWVFNYRAIDLNADVLSTSIETALLLVTELEVGVLATSIDVELIEAGPIDVDVVSTSIDTLLEAA